jgi:anti-anti-sigma factor
MARSSGIETVILEAWRSDETLQKGKQMSAVLDKDAIGDRQTDLPVLTVEFSCTGSLCVLTMSGELNGTSIAALEVSIDQIGRSACEHVVLDVTGLTRLDSVGIRVLIGLDQYVRALGARLTVTGAGGQVAEAFALTRLVLVQAPNGVGAN